MVRTAMGLGLAGGFLGILFSIIGGAAGGLAIAFGTIDVWNAGWLTVIGILIGILGIAGAGLSKHRVASSVVYLLGCAAGFVLLGLYWTLPGVLLLAACILRVLARSGSTEPIPEYVWEPQEDRGVARPTAAHDTEFAHHLAKGPTDVGMH